MSVLQRSERQSSMNLSALLRNILGGKKKKSFSFKCLMTMQCQNNENSAWGCQRQKDKRPKCLQTLFHLGKFSVILYLSKLLLFVFLFLCTSSRYNIFPLLHLALFDSTSVLQYILHGFKKE